MSGGMKRFFISGVLVAAWAMAASAVEPQTPASNARFGIAAEIPRGWVEAPASADGEGRRFTAPDGTATLSFWGNYELGNDVIRGVLIRPGEGETITEQSLEPDQVILSGIKGDRAFYRAHVLTCDGRIWINVAAEYPARMQAYYAPLVAHSAASLHRTKPCDAM